MNNITINLHQLAQLETDVLATVIDSQAKKDIKAAFKNFKDSLGNGNIKMTAVVSSTVKAIGYDINEEVLRIEYLNGSIYDYLGVSQAAFLSMMSAPSLGAFVNAKIKPNYGTVQLN